MPGMNGRGPLGKGPLSARQRGACNQKERDPIDQARENGMDIGTKQCLRSGRRRSGAGRGARKGQDRGGNR